MNEMSGVLVDMKPHDENNCIMVFECDQLLVADANIGLKVPLVFAAKILNLDKPDVENYDKKIKAGLNFRETKEFINDNPSQKLTASIKIEMKLLPQML
ncbi:hypothetical protein HYV79_02055 [Candidatus Woesearchaeota archaeon]|nr:hypothetical protein [Candidatus Woesearchaeota archaeon]